jgi:hypothetical protein
MPMKKKFNLTKIAIFTAVITVCCDLFPVESVAADKFVTVGTGSVTGTYYPVGGAICRVINRFRRDHGMRCSVEPTNGSVANIESLGNHLTELSIVQSDLQYDAYNGRGIFEKHGPYKSLRSVFSLYDDAFTIIARKDSKIKKFDDIKGNKVIIGSIDSGSRVVIENLIKAHGWAQEETPNLYEIKSSEQASALCEGKIDVMVYNVGHPNAAIQEVAGICETTIIPINGDKISKFIENNPYYVYTYVPGGMYAGNPHDVPTFGVTATAVTSERVSEKVIYEVVKLIFSNFEYFRNLLPVLSNLDPKKMALKGNTSPLHPGAAKYYKEQGIIP